MAKKVERWESSDGQIFESMQDCLDHEEVISIKEILCDIFINMNDGTPVARAANLAGHLFQAGYTVTKREETRE